jgi:transposase
MMRMLGMRVPPAADLQGLPQEALALIEQMQRHIEQQEQALLARQQQLAERERQLAERHELLQRKDREIALRDAWLEKLEFEIARFRRWKFGARTEAMNATQRRLFEETLTEDEAALQAVLERLRAEGKTGEAKPKAPPRRPRREALPAHLRRVEHRHEPEDTTCPNQGCGRPMTRIGEDVSERLDVVPAEFFVHRHVYGKWACRCCQTPKQQPAAAEIIDGGPASGLSMAPYFSPFRADEFSPPKRPGSSARDGGDGLLARPARPALDRDGGGRIGQRVARAHVLGDQRRVLAQPVRVALDRDDHRVVQ